jgi:hypothetical protein
MKAAIVILGDPKTGSEESLGRVFNALASAYEFQQNGDDVRVLFQGTGTRWVRELSNPEHPAHGLFESVRANIAGASYSCADLFGASSDVEQAGVALVAGNPVPGTSGLPSLRRLVSEGFSVLTF